jgi:hypothetical protein
MWGKGGGYYIPAGLKISELSVPGKKTLVLTNVGKRGGYYIPAGKGREKKNIFKIY